VCEHGAECGSDSGGEATLYRVGKWGHDSVQSWENEKRDHLGLDRTETEEKVETNQRILHYPLTGSLVQTNTWTGLWVLGPGRSLAVRQCAALALWKRGLASC
jgi:hypothetical protein